MFHSGYCQVNAFLNMTPHKLFKDIRSSAMLLGDGWWLTENLLVPSSMINSQAVSFFLNCWILEDGTDSLFRNNDDPLLTYAM